MSRCFLYPPPGYSLSRRNYEFLIESIKLLKEREIAKAEKKKNKKREKKRQDKKAKKDKSKHGFDKVNTHESKGSYSCKYLEDDEAEQLESSNLTEEHGQNFSCLSDHSTQNSNKRNRHVGIQAHGSLKRIRLSKKRVQGETSKHLPKLAQRETQVIVKTTANPLSKTTNSQSCPSTSTSGWVGRVAVDNINSTSSCSKVHENNVEFQYKNLIENWLPPSLQSDEVEDDQAWLSQRKPKHMKSVEEKTVFSNDTTCGSSTLWPRAQYIHRCDLFALPFTLLF